MMYETIDIMIEFVAEPSMCKVYIFCYIDRPMVYVDMTEVPYFE